MLTINDGYEEVDIDLLKPHLSNVNEGDFGAIQESVQINGFYGAIVANRQTNHILAGNHRYAVAKHEGAKTLPVMWVNIDVADEIRILLTDNRTGRLGIDNQVALAALLSELADSPLHLAGTGYDEDFLGDLLLDINRNATPAPSASRTRAEEGEDVSFSTNGTEGASEGKPAREYGLIVVCSDADERNELAAELAERGLEVRNVPEEAAE